MNLWTKIRNLILWGGVERSEYEHIAGDLHSRNRSIVTGFSLFAGLLLAGLFVVSLLSPSLSGNRALYGGGFLVAIAIFLTAFFPGRNNRTVLLIAMYLFGASLLAVGTVLGTHLSPNELAATYIALLLAVPQLFTDRPYRIYLLILASVAVFIAAAVCIKNPSTWNSDITNAVTFGVMSIVLSTYSIHTRISRDCLQESIRFMAENDQLTGLHNRNFYEKALQNISVLQSSNIYCVYVDANGLHELNNSKGHEAGDRMLQYIGSVLQNLFGEEVTYRIGGDEFVALGMDRDMETVQKLVTAMKQAVEAAGYHVAVGIGFREKKGIEIDDLIKGAEKEMYQDKAEYYQKSGNDRRKRG